MRAGAKRDDQGAAAVEFALVSVLLFTLLFGIIQYGYLFFQYQAGAAAIHDAARLAGLGINPDPNAPLKAPCSVFLDQVTVVADANGIPEINIAEIHLKWTTPPVVQHGSTGIVSITYKPTSLGAAFVPVPSRITEQAVATVEAPGTERGECIRSQVVP
jgi:hypothetical protein